MNAPPQVPADQTHRPATRVVAYIAEDGGTDVDPDQESTEWRVVNVFQGLGASARATLARDLGGIGRRIEDRKLNAYGTRIVEIWSLDEFGERMYPLLRGEMLVNRTAIADGSEIETAEVIIPPSWFGEICEGQRVWDPATDDYTTVHIDLEFNPLVDGRIVPNQAIDFVWIDPESARTDEAAEAHDLIDLSDVSKWDVANAVEALQRQLNADETYVANFQAVDDSADPPEPDAAFGDPPELEDETLPRGQYLPAYLDALLPKYGFQWTLDFKPSEEDPDQLKPQIRVQQRGSGIEKYLPYQAIGETLNTADTYPESIDIVTDLSRLANIVVGQGSLEEREVTIELVRGWPEADDATALGDLNKTDAENYSAANDNVRRKWVANEAGDYNGTRAEITEALDLSTVFPNGYVPKRRPIEDCLTYRAQLEQEGVRLPPLLEYSTDDGATWTRAGHDWRPLTHECGVYLTDPRAGGLVRALHDAGDDAKLRLTGTIRGDKRLDYEADRTSDSPTTIETRLFLDLSHRFHSRERISSGPHASQLTGAHDEADDRDALEEFVGKIADNEKAAVLQVGLQLHGLVFDFEIGDIINEIAGRNLSLNRYSSASGETRGVQVVGIAYNVQAQQTLLTVAPFDSYVQPPPIGRA